MVRSMLVSNMSNINVLELRKFMFFCFGTWATLRSVIRLRGKEEASPLGWNPCLTGGSRASRTPGQAGRGQLQREADPLPRTAVLHPPLSRAIPTGLITASLRRSTDALDTCSPLLRVLHVTRSSSKNLACRDSLGIAK